MYDIFLNYFIVIFVICDIIYIDEILKRELNMVFLILDVF